MLIATTFLAVIGLSVGLVMGARAQPRAPQGQARTAPDPAAGPGPRGSACRPETQDVAQRFAVDGTLLIELQIRTDDATAWICRDAAGRLFYHANRGGAEAPWIEGETALFLTGVVDTGAGYRASSTGADGRKTVFDVNRTALSITHADGNPEVQLVRQVVVG